ncbi:unnamed protein product [Heterobilharzia americana]|nr:unnamed protein product [Heterobilharzia americana]
MMNRLSKTFLRHSMRGRIKSSDDKNSESYLLQDNSNHHMPSRIVDTHDITNKSINNKLVNMNSPSSNLSLIQFEDNSTVISANNIAGKNHPTTFNLSNHVTTIITDSNHSQQLNNRPVKQFSEQNLYMLHPLTDDIWNNDSSTPYMAERHSISSDLSDVQSLTSSTDDWTKPYEMLSNLKSCPNDSSDILWLPNEDTIYTKHKTDLPVQSSVQYHQQQQQRQKYQGSHLSDSSSLLLLCPDEVGSEMLEEEFVGCKPNPSMTTTTTVTSTLLSTEHCQQSKSSQSIKCPTETINSAYNKFCKWKESNMSNITIHLDGLLCEADGSNIESRFWIIFQSLELYVKPKDSFQSSTSIPSSIIISKNDKNNQSDNEMIQYNNLWYIFLSIGSCNDDTSIEVSSYNNYSWIYINAILLNNWELNISSTIEQLFIKIYQQMNTYQFIKEINYTYSSISSLKYTIHLLMKYGSLTMKFISSDIDETYEQLKVLKKISLQQGLVIALTTDGIFQIYSEQNHLDQYNNNSIMERNQFNTNPKKYLINKDHLNDEVSLSSSSCVNNSFHNIIINRYAIENKMLKDKIEILTAELNKLKSIYNVDNISSSSFLKK